MAARVGCKDNIEVGRAPKEVAVMIWKHRSTIGKRAKQKPVR